MSNFSVPKVKLYFLTVPNLYSQKFTMQYQIASAQSEQDLENIQIEFTMMDFSEV